MTDVSPRQRSGFGSRFLCGGAWVFAGRVVGMASAFASYAVLARALSVQDFGLFVLAMTFLGFATIFAKGGLDRVVIRFLVESLANGNETRARQTLNWAIILSASCSAVTAICWVVFLICSQRYQAWQLDATFVGVTLVALVASAGLQIIGESFRGFHELRYSSLFLAQVGSGPLLSSLFMTFVLLAWHFNSLTLTSAIGCYAFSVAAILPIAALFFWRTASQHFNRGLPNPTVTSTTDSVSLREIAGVCVPFTLTQAVSFLLMFGDVWIAAACCSADELALFGASRRLTLMLTIPFSLINLVVLSAIPELHASGERRELQRLLQGSGSIAGYVSLLVFLPILVAPQGVLQIAFGTFYGAGATVLVILSVGYLIASFTGSCGNALMMSGHHNWLLAVQCVSVAGLFLIGPFMAKTYGMNGLAATTACIVAASHLVLWLLTKRLLDIWTNASPVLTARYFWKWLGRAPKTNKSTTK